MATAWQAIVITSLFVTPLMVLIMIMPQAIFGMMVCFRKRGPIHTDETGMPVR